MILENGYKTKTTFWSDFSIADVFGTKAVKDTFNRAFKEWKDNVIYGTELTIVMNMKCWYWYEHNNNELSTLYSEYYYKVRDYCLSHYKGEDLQYYYENTD